MGTVAPLTATSAMTNSGTLSSTAQPRRTWARLLALLTRMAVIKNTKSPPPPPVAVAELEFEPLPPAIDVPPQRRPDRSTTGFDGQLDTGPSEPTRRKAEALTSCEPVPPRQRPPRPPRPGAGPGPEDVVDVGSGYRRRRRSIDAIAQRWRIEFADAMELCANFEALQSIVPPVARSSPHRVRPAAELDHVCRRVQSAEQARQHVEHAM